MSDVRGYALVCDFCSEVYSSPDDFVENVTTYAPTRRELMAMARADGWRRPLSGQGKRIVACDECVGELRD